MQVGRTPAAELQLGPNGNNICGKSKLSNNNKNNNNYSGNNGEETTLLKRNTLSSPTRWVYVGRVYAGSQTLSQLSPTWQGLFTVRVINKCLVLLPVCGEVAALD